TNRTGVERARAQCDVGVDARVGPGYLSQIVVSPARQVPVGAQRADVVVARAHARVRPVARVGTAHLVVEIGAPAVDLSVDVEAALEAVSDGHIAEARGAFVRAGASVPAHEPAVVADRARAAFAADADRRVMPSGRVRSGLLQGPALQSAVAAKRAG